MKYKYILTRPDRPTFKMETNNINGLVRITNNYRRYGVEYKLEKKVVK